MPAQTIEKYEGRRVLLRVQQRGHSRRRRDNCRQQGNPNISPFTPPSPAISGSLPPHLLPPTRHPLY
eukprot:3097046-Pleurochrysis_carterae.AAC.2